MKVGNLTKMEGFREILSQIAFGNPLLISLLLDCRVVGYPLSVLLPIFLRSPLSIFLDALVVMMVMLLFCKQITD